MDKEENYSASITGNFPGLDYSIDHHHHHHQQQQLMAKTRIGETSGENNNQIVDYMLHNPQPNHIPSGFYSSTSPDKLSFADVMQFADFGPKLGLNQTKISEEETGIDPVYFLKFPVLNDRLQDDDDESLMVPQGVGTGDNNEDRFKGMRCVESSSKAREGEEQGSEREDVEEGRGNSGNSSVQLQILGENLQKNPATELKNKRKRPRTIKTSEEVESQRMTHIAVERNRRKQMNEHLRVLRSLMPGSYVQRGDQASIIGGAIEFVRELEQLLQCLESQKRRRLYGDPPPPPPRPLGDDSSLGMIPQPPQLPPFFPPVPLPTPNHDHQIKHVDFETAGGGGGGLLREETAECKSCLADVEVKMLGFDAIIKILSRRRPGQLVKTIAALEDLQLNILHTNITTIEQTVLYSFNVKVGSEGRFSAEEIASSVQQIFSFIHANSGL